MRTKILSSFNSDGTAKGGEGKRVALKVRQHARSPTAAVLEAVGENLDG